MKPIAQGYTTLVPNLARAAIHRAYENINMFPTIANDILQAKGQTAILDTWRLLINSTLGIGGLIDVASTFGLAEHSNDLGLTFAQWGDKKSPYLMLPLLGPTTIRDGMGLMLDYALFTPYPWIEPSSIIWGVLGLRYVDVRAELLEKEKLLNEALDPYSLIRDAYLQHRNYLITGETQDDGSMYVDESNDLV